MSWGLLCRLLKPIHLSLYEGIPQKQVHHNHCGSYRQTLDHIRRKILLNEWSVGEESLWYLLQIKPQSHDPNAQYDMERFVKHLLLLRGGDQEVVKLQDFEAEKN